MAAERAREIVAKRLAGYIDVAVRSEDCYRWMLLYGVRWRHVEIVTME